MVPELCHCYCFAFLGMKKSMRNRGFVASFIQFISWLEFCR